MKYKIQYYLDRESRKKVHWMSKKDWQNITPSPGNPQRVDLEETPLKDVARDASVVAAVAVDDNSKRIEIYREDRNDAPYIFNKDKYSVIENIHERDDYTSLISKSSTSDTPELKEFFLNHVALVKNGNSNDHWVENLPSSVVMVISK